MRVSATVKQPTASRVGLQRFFKRRLEASGFYSKVVQNATLLDVLRNDLPNRVYDAAIGIEQARHLSGLQKFAHVMGMVESALKVPGLSAWTPFLIPIIQDAITFLFAKAFASKWESLGLLSLVETLVGRDLDGDGSIAELDQEEAVTEAPAPPPVPPTTPETPEEPEE